MKTLLMTQLQAQVYNMINQLNKRLNYKNEINQMI